MSRRIKATVLTRTDEDGTYYLVTLCNYNRKGVFLPYRVTLIDSKGRIWE